MERNRVSEAPWAQEAQEAPSLPDSMYSVTVAGELRLFSGNVCQAVANDLVCYFVTIDSSISDLSRNIPGLRLPQMG